MGNNSPANAGNMGLIPAPGRSHMPWSGKAHVPQLLNPHTTTTEALVPRTLCSNTRETMRMRSPRVQLESHPPTRCNRDKLARQRTPSTAKNKYTYLKKHKYINKYTDSPGLEYLIHWPRCHQSGCHLTSQKEMVTMRKHLKI